MNQQQVQASLIPDIESPCIYLDIQINSGAYRALFDTGSPISVVSHEVCGNKEIRPYYGNFRSYTGHNLEILGYANIDITYNQENCPIPCVVVKSPACQILLGINWIRKYMPAENIHWGLENSTVGSNQISSQLDDNSDQYVLGIEAYLENDSDHRVKFVLDRKTICPARSVMTLEISARNIREGYYVIETSESVLRYDLLTIPSALVRIQKQVASIQIMNRSVHDYVLYPKMTIATGTIVEIVDSRIRHYEIPENWIDTADTIIPDDVRPILENYRAALNQGLFSVVMEPVAIPTGDARPIFRKPYRLGSEERNQVRAHVDRLISEGVVRESSSTWGAPCFLVDKKSGETRLVVDYTGLNAVTESDPYPLIDMTNAVQSLSKSGWFSHLDLDAAYHQIPVAIPDIPKTCFNTEDGSYEYLFAPFGLNRSGAALARNLDRVLSPIGPDRVINYSDDIVAHGSSRESALESLGLVLLALASCGLMIKLSKCIFLVRSITFLGFMLSDKGIAPDPDNVKPIVGMQRVVDKKQLSRFVNFASFYRQFIKGFASTVGPLRELLLAKNWEWSSQCESAFQSVKKSLSSPPVLAFFDPSRETKLKTDASKHGFGAVLLQNDGKRDVVIAYASRKTTPIEARSWAVTHLELGAVIFAMQRFHRYLESVEFTLFTDHHALCWLLNQKNVTGKLARWTLLLQEFRFKVRYSKPTGICDADCLSRMEDHTDFVGMVQTEELIDLQQRDPYCLAVKDRDEFVTRNGVLCKVYSITTGPMYKIVVPSSLREMLIVQAHDATTSGHMGIEKTLARVQVSYFWPNMRAAVEKYVRSCSVCQHRNIAKYQLKAPMQALPIVAVFQRVYMDYVICPRSSRGHSSILTVICSTSKFLIAIPMKSQSAVATALALLEKVFLIFGFPAELCSDRGTNFTSDVVRTITNLLGIHSIFSSAYSPHTSGQVERVNQSIIDVLAKVTKDEPLRWSDILPYAVWAYNSAQHASTGFSPYQVLFGAVPKDPNLDPASFNESTPLSSVEDHVKFGFTHVRQKVRSNLENAIFRYKKNADRSVRRDSPFVPGEKVLIKNQKSTKLGDRYIGPFKIIRIINPASLWVRDEVIGREFSVNLDKVKRYVERPTQPEDFGVVIMEESVPIVQPALSPPPNPVTIPVCPPAPKARRIDSNPSRRPIDRDPYELRPRTESR